MFIIKLLQVVKIFLFSIFLPMVYFICFYNMNSLKNKLKQKINQK